MKILHLSTYESHGGAAIAAKLLHQHLNKNIDIQSSMLVWHKKSNEEDVIPAYTSSREKKIQKFRYKTELMLSGKMMRKYGETCSTGLIPFSKLPSKIKSINPNILHIHWAQFGFLNLKDLLKINIPIVWTLHDLWPISDGIHYFDRGQLDKPKNSYLYNQKRKVYSKTPIHFIAVSRWVMSFLKNSKLINPSYAHQISNGIDCEAFYPIEKQLAKSALKLNPNKKTILFGAVSPFSAERKGFHYLDEAIGKMDRDDIEIIIFGDDEKEITIGKHKALCVGEISNRKILSLLYSAADAMIVPSSCETFGLTAAEAMACKTPVVAFNTSGLRDIVDHKENGYLAEEFKSDDLLNGINWVLDNPNSRGVQDAARNKIVTQFDIKSIVNEHIQLYQSLIKQ